MSSANKIRVCIIDDEYSNREFLSNLLSGEPDFEVVGDADGMRNGLKLIDEKKPHAVFLDIRMPDGNGFEMLSKLSVIDFHVIFVSAFDNYALQAFDFNALDYILKPIDQTKFSQTLLKLKNGIKTKQIFEASLKEKIDLYDASTLSIQRIPVHQGNKVILLPVSDIMSARADNGSTRFNAVNGQKFSSARQLSDFEFIFENYRFMVRINKSTVVNMNYIQSYTKGVTCILSLSDGTDFEVSRRKKAEVLQILSGRD